MTDCHEIEPLLAAHAFSALDSDEAALVSEHLRRCQACRVAYERLSALPALLDLAGGTEARFESPPPLLESSILAALRPPDRRAGPARSGQQGAAGLRQGRLGRLRSRGQGTARFRSPRPIDLGRIRSPRPGGRRHPRTRRLGAAALAASVLSACAILVWLLALPGTPSGLRLLLRPSGRQPGARAVALLRPRPWGTEVDLHALRLSPTRGEEVYEVWFVSARGRLSAGTFRVGPRGRAAVTLAAAARIGQYRSLGVTLQPDGLHPGRVGPNILRGRLPD